MRLLWVILALVYLTETAPAAERFIVLQSTTSTRNSGLLDAILPEFFAQSGIEVRVVAVGTGQAINNARNGDGDVLLVHDREAEETFVSQGFGIERFNLMFNDFVIVGPTDDPAGVAETSDVVQVIQQIAAAKQPFLSRGDDSGTHKAELRLWDQTGIDVNRVSGTWYWEAGAGMGTTINIAVSMGGYLLTDRASWVAFGNKSNHRILVHGDPRLFNQYGVILVNPERHPNTKSADAQLFVDWLLGGEGQAAIGAFRVNRQQLFFPNAATN